MFKKYSTYMPLLLLELWEQSKLTLEQAVGHILQRLLNHDERIRRLEGLAGLPPTDES